MQKFFCISMMMSLGLIHCSDDPPKNNRNQNSGPSAYVGDPCIPTNESDAHFGGFQVTGEAIEISAPACGGGVCLINHFQGRVSCPLGQASPQPCSGPDDSTACGSEASCALSAGESPTYVCHKAGNCQSADASALENQGKACCVPETKLPVISSVCGQCASDSGRAAHDAVYCSCRCGPAEGQIPAPDDVFCDCPQGFECAEVRKYLGIGDPKFAGKYCIRQGTAYTPNVLCGQIEGYFNSAQCQGIGP